MMSNKKSAMLVMLAVILVLTLLAGCSGNNNNNSNAQTNTSSNSDKNTDTNSTTKPEEPAKPAKPVEITFLTYDGASNPEGKSLRQMQVDAFNAANPDVIVKLDLQQNDSLEFLKKLDLMSLGGADYDVVALPSFKDYAERALKGLFAPVDEFIAAEGKTYDELFQYTAEVDGVNYGIPYTPGIYYVIINKAMLDEAGLPIPPLDWTWDDYRTYAKAMTKGSGANKVYGSYMHTWSEYRREALFSTKLDNPYVKEDGTSNLADPVFKDWLQFIKDMESVDGSQVAYKDAKATNMAYRDVYFSGKAAMILTGSWINSNIVDTENFPRDFQTVFAMMPRWKDSPAGRVTGSGTYNAINKGSANKEAAYRFMKYLAGEGAQVINDFSTMIGADNTATVEAIATGNEALLDKQSLLDIWNYPALAPNSINSFPEEFALLDGIYSTETELFMLDGQDLDKTISNLIKQAEDALKK
jgi:multiple sugar transport system substrate-binding protein